MKQTKPKSEPESHLSDLDEAIAVRRQAFDDLQLCIHDDKPKFTDAYARAANVVLQLSKGRKRAMTEFTDDEVTAHIRSLPDRRREAIVTAIQGQSLAGKPLF